MREGKTRLDETTEKRRFGINVFTYRFRFFGISSSPCIRAAELQGNINNNGGFGRATLCGHVHRHPRPPPHPPPETTPPSHPPPAPTPSPPTPPPFPLLPTTTTTAYNDYYRLNVRARFTATSWQSRKHRLRYRSCMCSSDHARPSFRIDYFTTGVVRPYRRHRHIPRCRRKISTVTCTPGSEESSQVCSTHFRYSRLVIIDGKGRWAEGNGMGGGTRHGVRCLQ